MSETSPSQKARRFDHVYDFKHRLETSGWWHSFELPDGRLIEGSCALDGLRNRIAQFPIPADLRGKRVLDIGAWDGWFSFEMERRGARVLAIDTWDNPRFRQMSRVLNSEVEYRQMDVYDLSPNNVGRFDIVLFMGVLYHLKHPLLALEKVCSVTDGMAAIDSFVLQGKFLSDPTLESKPVMEFYETSEFGGQTDNWIAPTLSCLSAFCRTAGFARVDLKAILEFGACLACHRRWLLPEHPQGETPQLLSAFHHSNFGVNFDSNKDEYLTCWFDYKIDEIELDVNAVHPQVGGYGVRPISLSTINGHWQIQFKCPPGLDPGWHEVCLSITNSPFSNVSAIAVDMGFAASSISIARLCDGITWKDGEIKISLGLNLTLWLEGLPENADRNNVHVQIDGVPSVVEYVEPRKAGLRQVNVVLTGNYAEGETVTVVATAAGAVSAPATVCCV